MKKGGIMSRLDVIPLLTPAPGSFGLGQLFLAPFDGLIYHCNHSAQVLIIDDSVDINSLMDIRHFYAFLLSLLLF